MAGAKQCYSHPFSSITLVVSLGGGVGVLRRAGEGAADRMSKFSFSIPVLVLAALSPCASAATIGAVASSVSTAPVGVATPVTFTATITDSSLIPGSVDLLSVDSAGRTTIVGIMHDDGLNGDATAGDHIYSFLVTVFQQTPGTINYRVSAAFQGSLVRPQSGLIPLTITGVSTAITITSPIDSAYLNIQPTPVTGTVGDHSAVVKVNGIAAQVSGTTFSASVPLQEGINTLTAVAQNSNGTVSTASETVTLDTTPPHITIDTPSNNAVTTASSINVAGIVNDIVVGTVNNQQATVTVNGIAAQVTNRTYSAVNVPLIMGSNTIQATGRDRAGNFATATVTVVRQAATQPSLSIVSGNNVTGSIGTLLASPLVVALRNGAGQAIPNTPVVFTITGSDGTVSATAGRGLSSVAVNTNAQGQAQVYLTLGLRAGAGNNVVTASSAGGCDDRRIYRVRKLHGGLRRRGRFRKRPVGRGRTATASGFYRNCHRCGTQPPGKCSGDFHGHARGREFRRSDSDYHDIGQRWPRAGGVDSECDRRPQCGNGEFHREHGPAGDVHS